MANWDILAKGIGETANMLAGGLLQEYQRQVEEQYAIRREQRAKEMTQENMMMESAIREKEARADIERRETSEIKLMAERKKLTDESNMAMSDYGHNLDNMLGDPEFLHTFQKNTLSGDPALMSMSLAQINLVNKLKEGGVDSLTPDDQNIISTMPVGSQGKLMTILQQNKEQKLVIKGRSLDLDATHARIRYENAVSSLYEAQSETGKVTPQQVESWDRESNAIKLQVASILSGKDWHDASMVCAQNGININDPKVLNRIANDPKFLMSVIPPDMQGMIGTTSSLARIIIDSQSTAARLKEASDMFRGKLKGVYGKEQPEPEPGPPEETPPPETTPPPKKEGGGIIKTIFGGSKFNISTGEARKRYHIAKDHQVFAAWDNDSMNRAFERAKEGDTVLVRRGERKGVYIFYIEDGKLRTRLLTEPQKESQNKAG